MHSPGADAAARTHVERLLADVEDMRGVQVLLAVESGPRAWGFPSPDSGHDVRFVFTRARDDYLSLRRRRGTIVLPAVETWDVAGWDVRKILALAVRGSATPAEWLASPIWYRGLQCTAAGLLHEAVVALTPAGPMLSHHVHMAAARLEAYRRTGLVRSLLNALREAATCRWIERHVEPTAVVGAAGRLVPVNLFVLLAAGAEQRVIDAATTLATVEAGRGGAATVPSAGVAEEYVTEAIAAGEASGAQRRARSAVACQTAWERADEAFRSILDAAEA